MTSKHCIQCKRSMTGRSDKKFCDDGCRNEFHNRKNGKKAMSVRQINAILRNNRKILQVFMPLITPIQIPKKTLETKGFNFNYFTGMEVVEKRTMHYCYDVGYTLAEDLCEMMPYTKEKKV